MGQSSLDNARIEFARDIFSNIQELLRFLDQKSGFLLAAVGLFSAALFQLLTGYLNGPHELEIYLIALLVVWYLLHIARATWNAILVVKARPNSAPNNCDSPELIFPLMLLPQHHDSGVEYSKALQSVQANEILSDYAQQIVEISSIYKVKHALINKSVSQLLWGMLPWFLTVLLVLARQVLPSVGQLPTFYVSIILAVALAILGWLVIRRVKVSAR